MAGVTHFYGTVVRYVFFLSFFNFARVSEFLHPIRPPLYFSVADPGCLSRIPDPDFYPSRIPDPKTATEERGENNLFVIPFYVATNFTKLKIILVLKC